MTLKKRKQGKNMCTQTENNDAKLNKNPHTKCCKWKIVNINYEKVNKHNVIKKISSNKKYKILFKMSRTIPSLILLLFYLR